MNLKILFHYLGIYTKCPLCQGELLKCYNRDRCTKCEFGNKLEVDE